VYREFTALFGGMPAKYRQTAYLGRAWQPFEALEVVYLTSVHGGSERGVRRISFQVSRGERVLASGKTTLLRALLGVLPCQSGSVLWNGHLVKDPAAYLVPPRTVGWRCREARCSTRLWRGCWSDRLTSLEDPLGCKMTAHALGWRRPARSR
jgi:energy-coupling factor transporter ATP-binding protein EcfA2